MSLAAWMIPGTVIIFAVLLVLGCAKLEHRQQGWECIHPNNEDRDGDGE